MVAFTPIEADLKAHYGLGALVQHHLKSETATTDSPLQLLPTFHQPNYEPDEEWESQTMFRYGRLGEVLPAGRPFWQKGSMDEDQDALMWLPSTYFLQSVMEPHETWTDVLN